MKSFIIIICYFTLVVAAAQEPVITFDQFSPRWYIVAKDTTFVEPSTSGLDQYSAFIGWIPFLDRDYTYSHFYSRNEKGEMDGGLVQKINNIDGAVEWSKLINTRHNYFQVSTQSLLPSSDSTLTFIGMKRTNVHHRPFPAWGNAIGYGVPWYITLDKKTGIILSEKVNLQDTTGVLDFVRGKGYFYDKNGDLIQLNYDPRKVKLSIFDTLDKSFIPFQYLDLSRNIPVENLAGESSNFSILNDSTLMIFYYSKSEDSDIQTDESFLDIYKLTKDTYSMVNRVDLLPYYHVRPDVYDINDNMIILNSKNGETGLIKSYKNPDNIFQYKNWFLWLDKNGKEKVFKKEIKLDNSSHVYSFINTIFMNEQNVYLAGFPASQGVHGFDILKINLDGTIEKTGALTTNDPDNNLRSSFFYVNEKGDVIMHVFWDRHYSSILGFHLSDLGIDFSSHSLDYIQPVSLLSLSPNPATNEVRLNVSDDQYLQGTVYIFSMKGEMLFKQKILSGDLLDVSSFPPGSYMVQFNPESRPEYFLTTKLVKQ